MVSSFSGTSQWRRSPGKEEKAAANSRRDEQLFLFGNSGGCMQRVWDEDGGDLEDEEGGQWGHLRCQAEGLGL